jgi:hypothetical protein
MFDSVDLSQIPPGAVAVAGYIDGDWPTYPAIVERWPHSRHLSITVSASQDAMCLDVETGDATPKQVPGWVRRRQEHLGSVNIGGWRRPIIYADLSTMPAVIDELRNAGIHRNSVMLWVAHYTGVAHIPSGFDACQWTKTALGRNLDQSLCEGYFLQAPLPPSPKGAGMVARAAARARQTLKAAKPHPKTAGATAGAAFGAIIMALNNLGRGSHVHLTTAEACAVSAALALIGGGTLPRPRRR